MSINVDIELGSAGDKAARQDSTWDTNAKRLQMFNVPNLYPAFLSEKGTPASWKCVLLPAFDRSLSPADSAYKTSYVSCRDRKNFTPEGAYQLTGWYGEVWGYSYYGAAKSSFLSPWTARSYVDASVDTRDPLAEIERYVRPKVDSDTRMKKLCSYDDNDKRTLIAKPTLMRLINIWGPATTTKSDDQGEKNRILCLKPMAFEKLLTDLNRTGTVDNQDKNWPQHVFGDPMYPERAILCSAKLYPSPTSGRSGFFGLYLGNTRFTETALHLDAQFTQITPKMLEGRYILNKVIYIPDYDEIMDLILSEGLIPMDIIQAACSRPPRVQKTYIAPEPVVKKEEPVFDDIPLPSPAPVPVSTPATPAPNEEEIQAAEARFKEVDGLIRAGQGTPELVDEFRALRDKIERVRGIIGL